MTIQGTLTEEETIQALSNSILIDTLKKIAGNDGYERDMKFDIMCGLLFNWEQKKETAF